MYVDISNWYLIYHDYDGKLCHGFYGLRKVVEIYKQKKCCLSSTMWTLKSRKCENRFIYSISKNDAYGLWCGLWWDSVTLGEFTQGIHTQ